jgi:PBP1b-binding outer membrane lipoprotein LpoB
MMRKEKIVLLILLSAFFAIGCTGNKGEAPNTTTSVPQNATTEVITVLRLLALLTLLQILLPSLKRKIQERT